MWREGKGSSNWGIENYHKYIYRYIAKDRQIEELKTIINIFIDL